MVVNDLVNIEIPSAKTTYLVLYLMFVQSRDQTDSTKPSTTMKISLFQKSV